MRDRADGLGCEMKENMNEQITKKAKHKARAKSDTKNREVYMRNPRRKYMS